MDHVVYFDMLALRGIEEIVVAMINDHFSWLALKVHGDNGKQQFRNWIFRPLVFACIRLNFAVVL